MNSRKPMKKLLAMLTCIVMIGMLIPTFALALSRPVLNGATAVGCGIKVSWQAVSGASGYQVYRKTGSAGWSKLAKKNGTTYWDSSAKEGVTYTYTVRPLDASGELAGGCDQVGVSAAWTIETATATLSAPTLLSATKEGSAIRVKWNKVSGSVKYRIYRKIGTGSWQTLTTVGSVDNYLDKDVTKGKTYTYTVRCVTPGGKNVSDYDHTGVTCSLETPQLATPVLISATGSGSGIKVEWNAVAGAAAYRVYRKTGSDSYKSLVDVTGTTYQDNATTENVNYTYTVRCLNDKGEVCSSYDKTGVTGCWSSGGNIPAPTLEKIAPSGNGVKITWGAVTGAASYKIYRKMKNTSWVSVGTSATTDYTDTDVNSGTEYTYTVACLDGSNVKISGYDKTGLTLFYCDVPVLESAVCVSDGIKVTWSKSPGAPSYKVYRKDTANPSWKTLATVTTTSYLDKTVSPDVTYTYTVRAVSSGKNASDFDHTGIDVIFAGCAQIETLTNKLDGVKITWKAITGATQYWIYRKTDPSTTFTLLTKATGTEYTDDQAVNNTKHTYRIVAKDASDEQVGTYDTAGKSIVFYAAPVLTDCVRSGKSLVLTWEAVEGATNYVVYRRIEPANWVKIGTTTNTSYADTTMPSGTLCKYMARVANASGTPLSDFERPGLGQTSYMEAPILDKVTCEDGFVLFTWNEVDKADNYIVYRKDGSSTSFKRLGVTGGTDTYYEDHTAVSGTTYTYTVAVRDAGDTEDMSLYDTTGLTTAYFKMPVLDTVTNKATGVEFTWKKVDGVSSYQIYRKTGSSKWTKIGTSTTTSYLDTKVASDGSYWYSVSCLKNGNEVSGYDQTGLNISYYAPPVMATITVQRGGKVKVTWNSVDGIDTYRLYRKDGNATSKPLTDVTGLEYTDTTVTSGIKYTYTAKCMKGGNLVSVSQSTVSVYYLLEPTISSATSSKGTATIKWSASDGATSYEVWRKENIASGTWKKVTTVSKTNYTDTGVTVGKTYVYRIKAVNSSGKSANSLDESVTIVK